MRHQKTMNRLNKVRTQESNRKQLRKIRKLKIKTQAVETHGDKIQKWDETSDDQEIWSEQGIYLV